MRARRHRIEPLISTRLAALLRHNTAIEIDWRDDAVRPAGIVALAAAGHAVPGHDARLSALRAAACEAIMVACD